MIVPDALICRRLRIRGRVQGVCYRDWAIDAARALGITGWVRNRMDGSVEALAMGASAAVDAFVARCRNGPPAARVDSVDVCEQTVTEVDGFRRLPTL